MTESYDRASDFEFEEGKPEFKKPHSEVRTRGLLSGTRPYLAPTRERGVVVNKARALGPLAEGLKGAKYIFYAL